MLKEKNTNLQPSTKVREQLCSRPIKQRVYTRYRTARRIHARPLCRRRPNPLVPNLRAITCQLQRFKQTVARYYIRRGKVHYTERHLFFQKKEIRKRLQQPQPIQNTLPRPGPQFYGHSPSFLGRECRQRTQHRLKYNDAFVLYKLMLPLSVRFMLKKMPKKRNYRKFYIKCLSKDGQIRQALRFFNRSFQALTDELWAPRQSIQRKQETLSAYLMDQFNIKLPKIDRKRLRELRRERARKARRQNQTPKKPYVRRTTSMKRP